MLLKRVGILAAGGAISQAIQFVAQPALAHLYAPSSFGVFGQILAVSSVVVVVGTLQMHTAVVLPRDANERSRIFSTGLLSSTLVSTVALVAYGFFWASIFQSARSMGSVLSSFAITLAISYSTILKGWQTASGDFKTLSLFSIVRAAGVVVAQFALGVAGIPNGLILGAAIGEGGAVSVLLASRKTPSRELLAGITARNVWESLWTYRRFAVYGTIQELVSVAVAMMPMYFFAREYSAAVGGQYAMAHRLIWAPVVLAGGALSQVVYHHFANIERDVLRESVLLGFGKRLALILIAGCFAVAFAPSLLLLVLGEEWMLAASLSRWIVLWGIAFLLSVPHRVLYRVFQCQHIQLIVDTMVCLTLFVVFRAADHFSALVVIRMVAGIGVVQNIVLVCVMAVRLRRPGRG